MRLKLFTPLSRQYGTAFSNPLFLQNGCLVKEKTPGLVLNLKELETLPKLIQHCTNRNNEYHDASTNFHEAKKFKSLSPITISSLTPYFYYSCMAMNCFRGYWYDSLVDREIAEQIIKQNARKTITLDSINENRDQLSISRLLPPLILEMFSVLHRTTAIPYDSSQVLSITANFNQDIVSTAELKIPISLPLLSRRSDCIFKLALYCNSIFNLLGDIWLYKRIQSRKFLLILPSNNVAEMAKIQERILKKSGDLLEQNAKIMHMAAQMMQIMHCNEKGNENSFSLDELSDIMKSWNIPIALLKSCDPSNKSKQGDDNDIEKINKEYPNVVDNKKLEQVLAEASKNGPYY